MVIVRVCAPDGCVTAEGVAGALADAAPSGDIPRYGVVEGDAVALVVMVKCSPRDSKVLRPNRVFITSLEPETENEQGDGGIVSFHVSDGFVRNVGFLSICISSKIRNWYFVANSPSSMYLYNFFKVYI